MRLTEYFHYIETGERGRFTHLSVSPAMERQRRKLLKEDAAAKREAKKKRKQKFQQLDLLGDE